jgi:hypothetical protein
MSFDDENIALRELKGGVAFWRTTAWCADFHNSDYERWFQIDHNGRFTAEWWNGPNGFLKGRLQPWMATRGHSHAAITARFLQNAAALSATWDAVCFRHLQHDDDISALTWEEVGAFADLVGTLKPTRNPSLVFASKFCHFLLPKVFPVGDNYALGVGGWSYERYFRHVQRKWSSTGPAAQAAHVAEVTRLIEEQGEPVSSHFPMINKIVELRMIGQRRGSV